MIQGNLFSKIEKAQQVVKHWWILTIAAVAIIATGITVLFYPLESFLILSIIMGIGILLSGISELTIAITSRNWFATRSWNIIGGIIDILLGILLCSHIGISATLLPILIGLWLMTRSFIIISLGSDLNLFLLKGSKWTILCGIVLLLLSITIIIQPFKVGIPFITALVSIGFVLAGIIMLAFSFQLRNMHTYIKRNIIEDVDID